jgi:exosortase
LSTATQSKPIDYQTPGTPAATSHWPINNWIALPLLAAAFVLVYWSNLYRLWWKTNPFNGQTEWVHAVFVPIVGIFYLYLNRDALVAAPVRPLLLGNFGKARWISAGLTILAGVLAYFVGPNLPGMPQDYGQLAEAGGMGLVGFGVVVLLLDWGIGSLLFGLAVSAYGIYPGQNDFIKDVGMVLVVFGVVLALYGWKVMEIAWFPIAFLLAALPWPGLFYSRVAMPLQEIAAKIGVVVMNLCGMDTQYSGTVMYILMPDGTERPLNVAEACAGVKSLMTFVALGAALAFISNRPLWQRLLITAIAVPIAVLCNVFRVAAQGLLDYYGGSAWTQGAAHMYSGVVFLLIPGFIMLLGSIWLLDKLIVEEADDDDLVPVKKPATAGGGK